MNNFIFNIKKINKALNRPLPGYEAQSLMEPITRRIELEKQKKRTIPIPCSILILLYPKNDKIYTVMIKRTIYDGVHSGQIAFPGGRKEQNDTDLIETALRETEEEIGVNRTLISTIGTLTQLYIPPSHYNVLPIIGFTEFSPIFIQDKNEVDDILEIDISEFINTKNIKQKEIYTQRQTKAKVICYNIQNEIIWGATAMIISEFVEIVKTLNLEY